MKQRLYYIPIVLIGILLMGNCAKKGRPSGGPLDTIPPMIVRSVPENFTTNFSETEIRIYFDEYIKLKNLQENLIISPPMKYDPIITPLSTSKMLRIRIQDTLAENTTYSFNFGKSIVDNNEENEFDYFKYVFSTGSYIDSLKVKGNVLDAQLPTADFPVTVMLYEVNEDFKDSLIYSEKPRYIATTRDSSNTFEITNVKEGEYLLLALKEKLNDYTFQPKTDKIGFLNDNITLPSDSSYAVTIFKEVPEFKFTRPSQLSKYHIVFGYEGEVEGASLEPLSQLPDGFSSKIVRDLVTDTLHYWFKPEIEADSLLFMGRKGSFEDSLEVRMKDLYADSLLVTAYRTGTLIPRDTFSVKTSTPIISIDESKITIMDKDTLPVRFSSVIHPKNNLAQFIFETSEDQRYQMEMLPGALTDFHENVSDSLSFTANTKQLSDYGTISLQLQNVKQYPVIVQLLTEKFEVVNEQFLKEEAAVYFDYIDPGNYFIRLIIDANANNRWDSGNFLQRLQPEDVVYYPKLIEVLANWSLNETFILD
ncbi:Ig-like domain-containing protein [Aureitalea sp. L0-47]|uniref:Ig-like domain-containing protein n=1 Tax=Aureitalea sp. L0-47 TaxID=2816962 RepID=UPI002237875D|nr:Ig-like domain-containing protein [Aureitalea sp. L0-47]MCW5518342.1 Ig-like domain-containing protein [Aureitalea sp. L0-47]